MLSLKGKNIIVMGGTSGLGLAGAKSFIDAGASVVAIGRNRESCEDAETELGKNAIVLEGDATHPATMDLAMQAFTSKSKTIHGLFHVAGGSGRSFGDGPLHELTIEGWNKTFELNLTSLMLSNQSYIKYLLANNIAGSILNMGSVLGYSPAPKYFATHAYAATKSAIIGFSKSIASYYAPHNIRINVIAPSLFVTPMAKRAAENDMIMAYVKTKQPLQNGRAGYPEDIAGAACYFMSDASSFTTGQVLSVDGGWSITDGQY